MPKTLDFVIRAEQWQQNNSIAEFSLNLAHYDFDQQTIQIMEIDQDGEILDLAVPFQVGQGEDLTRVIVLLRGQTSANTERYYRIASAMESIEVEPLLELTDGVIHQEQESYRIKTPIATYLYHKLGAGFASMFDVDGNDWLSYRPYGGSDGKYRGIPNLAHPENNFHPGGTGCTSRVVSQGALKVTIESESNDGLWASRWEILPTHARLTVLKVGHPYWFLYEGTPGGKLDEAGDYCVISDGTRRDLTERWEQVLPDPEWIYFGASNTERVLYLVHHEADQHMDSYWSMEQNMTVFGFGRNGLEKYMTETPSQFTVGFAESSDFDSAQQIINSAYQPLQITIKE